MVDALLFGQIYTGLVTIHLQSPRDSTKFARISKKILRVKTFNKTILTCLQ